MLRPTLVLTALALLSFQEKEELRKVLKDEAAGPEWIYDDFPAGQAAARKDGRPMLVVFR